MAKHEGWENYQTWNINLWIMNEYPLYLRWVEKSKAEEWTAESVMKFVRTIWPISNSDRVYTNDPQINWQELAQAWNVDRSELTV